MQLSQHSSTQPRKDGTPIHTITSALCFLQAHTNMTLRCDWRTLILPLRRIRKFKSQVPRSQTLALRVGPQADGWHTNCAGMQQPSVGTHLAGVGEKRRRARRLIPMRQGLIMPYLRWRRHRGGAASFARPQTTLLSQTRPLSNPCAKAYIRPYSGLEPNTYPKPYLSASVNIPAI